MAHTRKQKAKAVVTAWLAKNRKQWKVLSISHVYPCCYVIGYAAPLRLVVARPWMDSEPHMATFDMNSPIETSNDFETSLKPGDWCISAYVMAKGRGTVVFVKANP